MQRKAGEPTEEEGAVIDERGSEQLLKRVLKEGSGETPPSGGTHTMVMHYTGRLLDGTVFDSSVRRNEPFEFVLGAGQVIKGWDIGVKSMKKGEKAVLTCPPGYAYGAAGAGGVIPPNATLEFEVELIDWKEGGGGSNPMLMLVLVVAGYFLCQYFGFMPSSK